MKRKTIAALIAVLTIGMSTSVWAAQSISQIIPEAPKTEQGVLFPGRQCGRLHVSSVHLDREG